MRRILKFVYWIAGLACIGYYFLLGYAARFGLDMSWIWLAGGGILIVAGLTCRSERIPGWIRIAWRTLLCAGLALVVVLESMVISGMSSVPPQGLDYVIVLGAKVNVTGPSPALRRRLNATLAYLEDNPDTMVIASGGRGADEPMSEALCIQRELIAAGIEPERILLEDRSTTTAENMAFSLEWIDSPDASVGIVTNNYHVFRALALAKKAGIPNVYGVAAEYTGHTLFHYMIREALCLVADGLMGNL